MILKRINAFSCAKVLGLLYLIIGLIIGGIFAIASLMGATFGASEASAGSAFVGLVFGVGAVVFLPIFYGILGFIVGLVVPTLYNILAGMVGGIEIDVQ
jgi:hypothetical protein